MDLTTIYCDLDDFYSNFSFELTHDLVLGHCLVSQSCKSLIMSEFITILVMFHQSQDYGTLEG